MLKYSFSMLCLIINGPSCLSRNIYMQSVPGSHSHARGREVCVFIALNTQILSANPVLPPTMKKHSLKQHRHFICCCTLQPIPLPLRRGKSNYRRGEIPGRTLSGLNTKGSNVCVFFVVLSFFIGTYRCGDVVL